MIPPSPYVDWLHIGVGQRRFLLDGGIGDSGMKFCAAELLIYGSGVFAFMIRPSIELNPPVRTLYYESNFRSSVHSWGTLAFGRINTEFK